VRRSKDQLQARSCAIEPPSQIAMSGRQERAVLEVVIEQIQSEGNAIAA
jgi:hypothetical protein